MRLSGCLSCLAYRRNAHAKERHRDQLGLEKGADVGVGTPPPRAVCPGDCSVHDGIVLLDVEVSQGPLAGVTGSAAPVADGTLHSLDSLVGDPDVELIGCVPALLKPDIADLPLLSKAPSSARRAVLACLLAYSSLTSPTRTICWGNTAVGDLRTQCGAVVLPTRSFEEPKISGGHP